MNIGQKIIKNKTGQAINTSLNRNKEMEKTVVQVNSAASQICLQKQYRSTQGSSQKSASISNENKQKKDTKMQKNNVSDSQFYDKKLPDPISKTKPETKTELKRRRRDSNSDDSQDEDAAEAALILKILTKPHKNRQKKMKTCIVDSHNDKPDLKKDKDRFEDSRPLMKQKKIWVKKFQAKSMKYRSLYEKDCKEEKA
jgi:hypothetical protein